MSFDARLEARRLYRSGYRCISRRHAMLGRIDREDWREVMAGAHPGGMSWVESMGPHVGDHYRRCYSKDRIAVSADVYHAVRRLSRWDDGNEYKPQARPAKVRRLLHL